MSAAGPGAPGWSGAAQLRSASGEVRHLVSGTTGGRGGHGDGDPCGPTTRFQAGSVSKQLLSVVALALVGRGAVGLHEPVTRWLPDLPGAWSAVALHHLLSHTSGAGHWGDLPGVPPLLQRAPSPGDLLARTAAAPLRSAPGAAWRYSGPGYLVAARVLEAAAGQPYGDLVAEVVVGPAAMASTTSGAFPLPAPGVAAGHRAGRPVAVDPGFAALPGTGDLWTTTRDLLALDAALWGGRLLEPDLLALLRTAHAAVPAAGGAEGAEPPTVATEGYGYGTFTGRVLGEPAWFVPGDNPGYQSLLARWPASGASLAVLTNDEEPGVAGALAAVAPLVGVSDR